MSFPEPSIALNSSPPPSSRHNHQFQQTDTTETDNQGMENQISKPAQFAKSIGEATLRGFTQTGKAIGNAAQWTREKLTIPFDWTVTKFKSIFMPQDGAGIQ